MQTWTGSGSCYGNISPLDGWPPEGWDWEPDPQHAQCPEDAGHDAALWDDSEPCPRCGHRLRKEGTGILAD